VSWFPPRSGAFIDDNVAIYAGPGLLYWSGRAKYEGSGIASLDGDWPRVKQFAFNGRLGMYARMASKVGLFGHLGQVLATNSAEDTPGESLVDEAPRGQRRPGVRFLAARRLRASERM
jgi:hypothetical protein